MNKSVVLLSGGMDSLVATFLAQQETEVIEAIFFAYGQVTQITEERYSRHLAHRLGIPWRKIILPLGQLELESALVNEVDGDTCPYDADLNKFFVPGRNAIFLTYAAIRAYQLGAQSVWSGICSTSPTAYPDCKKKFIDREQTALCEAFGRLVILETPLIDIERWEAFKIVAKLSPRKLGMVRWDTFTGYNDQNLQQWDWGWAPPEEELDPAQQRRREAWFLFTKWLETKPELGITWGNNPL